jgi:hypothetical protein
VTADELREQIKLGEAKLQRAKEKATALPKGMHRMQLEHLIKGAESGLQTLRCQLIEKESSLF